MTYALPKLAAKDVRGLIDFAILTIREDEESAILDRFPPIAEIEVAGPQGARWPYAITEIQTAQGYHTLAMIRCLHQGQNQAQRVASDLIQDLSPGWIFTVGIAGGYPDDDFSLGDVILSDYVYDLSVSAATASGRTEYSVSGGFLPRPVEQLLASLSTKRKLLENWGTPAQIVAERPAVQPGRDRCAGDEAYRRRVRGSLSKHFSQSNSRSSPHFKIAGVVSSNTLVKDPALATQWKQFSRRAAAIEMEFGGVYTAARGRGDGGGDLPVITIRGVSDIVGLERNPLWTTYACHTAAAFTRRLLEVASILPARPAPLSEQLKKSQQRVRVQIELETDNPAEVMQWFLMISERFSGDARLVLLKELGQ